MKVSWLKDEKRDSATKQNSWQKEKDVHKATIIKIVPFRYQGKGMLIELEHSKVLFLNRNRKE